MIAVIKSSLSLPIDLCNIVNYYAVPRSMMLYSKCNTQYIYILWNYIRV